MSRRTRLSSPTIFNMRIGTLFALYGWHLRRHRLQEFFAGLGIALGVALFFGVLVANTSVISSESQLIHAVVGSARLQLSARSSAGFDEKIAYRARNLPGVELTAPVLRLDASIVSRVGRRQAIQLIGVTPALAGLGASATKEAAVANLLLSGGIGLPSTVANAIRVDANENVAIVANGEAHPATVTGVLGSQLIGPVASSPVAVALLNRVQKLADLPGRVTEVLVRPYPGDERKVERELRTLAAGRLDVGPADNEIRLLADAAAPSGQSTTLFAAISAIVGFLLALNAMLLTVPERRRLVAELRTQGYGPRQVLLILTVQALLLGIVASTAGIVIGVVLARTVFDEIPSYLAVAFPISAHSVIVPTTILLALACGVFAVLAASIPPALDLRPSRPLDAVLHDHKQPGQRISRRSIAALGVTGVSLIAIVAVGVLIVPSLTIAGGIGLALASVCLAPVVLSALIHVLGPLSEHMRGSMLALAIVELRATATRSIVLAAIAAVAVYGSVAIQGARADLSRGLHAAIVQFLGTADIWVTTGDSVFTTDSFHANGALVRIAHAQGVATARVYQGGLLNVDDHRLWIRARPPSDRVVLQSSQLLEGDYTQGSRLIRRGGWAAISTGFAAESGLHVGEHFYLPTPSGPERLGVAAITTNTGWPSGAITLSTADYQKYWQTSDPAAIEVNLKPGVSATAGTQAIRAALGSRPGLSVQTRAQREAEFDATAHQAVRTLGEISTLLLVTSALAVAIALSAAIWQRRRRFASLKTEGFTTKQVWRSLLIESTVVLGVGCLDGAILGIYGHALAGRWLKLTTGFPAPFSLGEIAMLLMVGLVAGIALSVIALPGLAAALVSPEVSFQE
ncbi:MAG: FtsX-like permease family protein [Solirubrobacteraceae bacterium]